MTVPMMSLGAKGVISVLSNVIPGKTQAMCRAALEGNFNTAAKLQLELQPLIEALFCEVNPIPIKAACSTLFGYNNTVRPPLNKISPGNEAKLREILSEAGLFSGT